MAAKKKSTSRGSASKKKARTKVGKVMHEYKHGELKSGGRKKVKSRKQAIAIGLSEARRSGADVPPPKRKGSSKKTASKKNSSKRSSTKKSASKKSSGKRS
jgi:Family of unknown function (DUF6496)